VIGTLIKRLTVRTLDAVVERGRESGQPTLRMAANGLDRARGWVGLDRTHGITRRTVSPPWDGSLPEQPMWQTDKDKLHKHRVDRGIIKTEGAQPARPAEPAVKIYIKRGCPYCRAAIDLVNERNIPFTQIDYSDDHDLRRAIRGQTGRKTSPHVFIHGKSIGGYDELRELDQSGALKDMLEKPGAVKVATPVLPPFDEEDDDSEDEISAQGLRTRVSEGAKLLLLDVREPDERNRTGVLPHAVLIPLGELEQRHAELDPTGVWITYCQAGKRSLQAQAILRDKGFGRVVSLRGGIVAWTEAGGATVAPSQVDPHGLVPAATTTPTGPTTAVRRVSLPVIHPERSPFEDLLFGDPAEAEVEHLVGDALIARVREVLEEVRPMVQSDGGDIELMDVIDDVVGVRLTGNCIGCPSSQATLRQGIERKLKLRIPQIKGIASPQLTPLA
jgi:Fe-S cluster biogenesis protein NfuA/rhodanese-related sulfurtransferase/glutaredoxin